MGIPQELVVHLNLKLRGELCAQCNRRDIFYNCQDEWEPSFRDDGKQRGGSVDGPGTPQRQEDGEIRCSLGTCRCYAGLSVQVRVGYSQRHGTRNCGLGTRVPGERKVK